MDKLQCKSKINELQKRRKNWNLLSIKYLNFCQIKNKIRIHNLKGSLDFNFYLIN